MARVSGKEVLRKERKKSQVENAKGSNGVIDINKIWMPQAGPQLMANTCPVDIILFGGSRGGGKTDCALGRQIIRALLYGTAWNGLFIRKSYKYFAELRRRITSLINIGLPAELVGSSQGTNYLRFDNGAIITLTVVESIEKAEFFQGQQFCVAEGTLIRMGDGNGRPIESIKVGDMVATLEGPRKVLRVMPARTSPCVRVETPFGVQEHPTDHPIFSTGGWLSYSSVLESDSKGAELSSPVSSGPLDVNAYAVLVPRVQDQAFLQAESSSERRISSRFLKRLQAKDQIRNKNLFLISGRSWRLQEQAARFPGHLSACFYGPFLRDQPCGPAVKRVQGFRWNCLSGLRPGGGRVRLLRAFFQGTVPLRGGVDKRRHDFLAKPADALGNIQGCSRLNLSKYEHPYTGKMREVVVETFSGACSMTPCGDRVVYDLTVEEANHYISHETGLVNKNTEISIEEGCQFGFFLQMLEMLKGCMRSPHGIKTTIFVTANPGGAGHSSVKNTFMPKGTVPMKPFFDDAGLSYVFIPSSVEDNKILCANDPRYVMILKSIKDPALRKAWLEGDWDVVLGGFFGDLWNNYKHVVNNFIPPRHWPRIVSMDWGSSTPFSIGYHAVSDGTTVIPECGDKVFPRGAIIRYHEWYGCPKGEVNKGLRLDSGVVAERMLERERHYGLLDGAIDVDRVADPSIFSVKDGPSTAENMAMKGVVWRKGDNNRIAGWNMMRGLLAGQTIERLYESIFKKDGSLEHNMISEVREPMFYACRSCSDFIRTFPELQRDEKNYEDVDTDGEDHAADDARYCVMSRPNMPIDVHVDNVQSSRRDGLLSRLHEDNGAIRDLDGLSSIVTLDNGDYRI